MSGLPSSAGRAVPSVAVMVPGVLVAGIGAPSARTLLALAPDPASGLLVVVLGALYAVGVRRTFALRPGRPWPRGRSVCFALGLAVIVVATQTGLARYDTVLLSLHTVQHLLLGMVGPLLLALGAPVTLALGAVSRRGRVVVLGLVRHPVVGWVTHPVVSWGVFSLSLFAIYFTPLLELSLRNGLVHTAVHLHFVAAGFLFCSAALAIDPSRHRVGAPARLLLVLLSVPFHALLGLAISSGADNPLGADVYGAVVRSWGPTMAADQRAAAAVLWGIGEVWGLVLGAVVAIRWMGADARRQEREDERIAVASAGAGGRVQPTGRPSTGSGRRA